VPTEFQHFWRCAHYPSALQNFQDNRTECEWECTCVPLKWYHNGTHPQPKSWPAVRDRKGSLSAARDLPP